MYCIYRIGLGHPVYLLIWEVENRQAIETRSGCGQNNQNSAFPACWWYSRWIFGFRVASRNLCCCCCCYCLFLSVFSAPLSRPHCARVLKVAGRRVVRAAKQFRTLDNDTIPPHRRREGRNVVFGFSTILSSSSDILM